MEGIHDNPLGQSAFEPAEDYLNTINDNYFAGRKVEVNNDILLSICTAGSYPFRQQVKTLFEVASNSRFSPPLKNQNDIDHFKVWFFGSDCPIAADKNVLCSCEEAHKAYPGQKVGGVLTENQHLKEAASETENQNTGKESSQKVNALLSVAACNLISSEWLVKVKALPEKITTDSSEIIEATESKRKESKKLLEEAYKLNQNLTQNQIRSWIIQYALHNKLIKQVNDIEKIKSFRASFQNKVSDRWFKMLTESGFYPNTETLASPVYLAEQLPLMSNELIRVNSVHPKIAYDSAILLFSNFDSLSQVFHKAGSFLPEPDNDYWILLKALSMAIFDDEARRTHQVNVFFEKLRIASTISPPRKTRATTRKSRCIQVINENSMDMDFKIQAISMQTKKPGQDETSATWLTESNNFAEPKDLITAFAYIFNIMTYPKPDNKTRIYNFPDYKKQISKAYKILDDFRKEAKSDNLHGYSCFLMGWLHEKQLIENSSPLEAASFYQKAAQRGLFIPLSLKAGDLFAEIEDYQSACRCYEYMYESLLKLACPASTDESKTLLTDSQTVDQSGYLSKSFLDFLQSKIEYFKIKAKDTIYLKALTPDEIQRYIEGEKPSASPPHQPDQPEAVKSVQPVHLKKQTKETVKETVSDGSDNETQSVTSTARNLRSPSDTGKTITKSSDYADHRPGTSSPAEPEDSSVVTARKTAAKMEKCNLIRNRLTIKWTASVHTALKNFSERKQKATYTHEENIIWLNNKINKLRKNKGVETLREHLAWEHIHIAEQSQFDGAGMASEQVREHLNNARDLLLENIIKKTGIQYTELPGPEKFEADILSIVKTVKSELSSIDIAEWLFGIVCQARSLGHVFSTFKLLYPKSENIASLNRGWFSLKHLYRTP